MDDKKKPMTLLLLERIEALEKAVRALQTERAVVMRELHNAPRFSANTDEPVSSPVTYNGVSVGDRAWVAFTKGNANDPPRVLAASVNAIALKTGAVTVVFDVDGATAAQPVTAVFPYSPQGKAAAQVEVDAFLATHGASLRKKEAARAAVLVYAMEGDISVEALSSLHHRKFVALAGLCGLSQFRELKALSPEEKAKRVAAACEDLRTAPKGSTLLKEAKKLVAAWDAESFAMSNEPVEVSGSGGLFGALQRVKAKEAAANGRSMPTNADVPSAPVAGDMVVHEKQWYRVLSVEPGLHKGDIRLLCKHMSEGTPATFTEAVFTKNSKRKNTPVWAARMETP